MNLISDETIRGMCPNAANIIITGDISHKDVGIKVGLFAQAAAITYRMDEETQKRTVRNLYMDLVMMNRREEQQRKEAAEEARGPRN